MKVQEIKGPRSDDAVFQILLNRGIKDPENFFELDEDVVQSPYDLEYIEEAADKIIEHIHNGSKIGLLIDADVDGYTSAALLVNYIYEQEMNGDFSQYNYDIHFIHHEKKEHGLNVKIMRYLRDELKPNLLIIPDASGSAEQYEALNGIGIDIVVLDHHQTAERGDGIHTIVVNNQQSLDYKNKALSGVGIVWQLCRVFDDKLEYVCADQFLDLVAVGLVSDVMDLRSPETRYLVMRGIQDSAEDSYFLQFLKFKNEYSLKGKFNPNRIAWVIGPIFNAVTRIGTEEDREMTFKALLTKYAHEEVKDGTRGHTGTCELVAEAYRLASNTRSRQQRRQNKLSELIDTVIEEEMLFNDKVIVVAIDDFNEEQRSLSGLIANKLQDQYSRPVVLLFQNEDGSYSGSLRAPDNIPAFENFRSQCKESGLVIFAAGHEQAAGIGIEADNILSFIDYFNEKYADIDVQPQYKVDFILDANDESTKEVILQIGAMEDLWGPGLPEPIVAVKNVQFKPGTISLYTRWSPASLQIKDRGIEYFKKPSSQEEFRALKLEGENGAARYYTGTVVGTCKINDWGGNVTPQITVTDYELDNISYDF